MGGDGRDDSAAEYQISRFPAVAMSWWNEGRLPGRVDFWKKEGEARYTCLGHPSGPGAQGAKELGWGVGGGEGGCVDANGCGCLSKDVRRRARQEVSKRLLLRGGVVWCVCAKKRKGIGWMGRRCWWRRLISMVDFLHLSECR